MKVKDVGLEFKPRNRKDYMLLNNNVENFNTPASFPFFAFFRKDHHNEYLWEEKISYLFLIFKGNIRWALLFKDARNITEKTKKLLHSSNIDS